jgi:hypothetical protein
MVRPQPIKRVASRITARPAPHQSDVDGQTQVPLGAAANMPGVSKTSRDRKGVSLLVARPLWLFSAAFTDLDQIVSQLDAMIEARVDDGLQVGRLPRTGLPLSPACRRAVVGRPAGG